MNDEALNDYMLAYRKKNFKCEVFSSKYRPCPNEMCVSISHNGYQFSTITLLPHEARIVMRQMREFLKTHKSK